MTEQGVSRREFLTGAFRSRPVALAATGGLVWSHFLEETGRDTLALRPPGALPEADFAASCIRCGQCVEACPYDTLKLAMSDSGHAPLGAPYFEPRTTPCQMCPDVPCAAACPTEALQKSVLIDDAEMGLAVLLDQETCLAYQGLRCEVCYRACPKIGKAVALIFRPNERTGRHSYFLPVINSEFCTGCGICEHACVLDEPAIRVLPRSLAKGKLGSRYRFGWKEETEITPNFVPTTQPAPAPELDQSLERALEQMNAWESGETP